MAIKVDVEKAFDRMGWDFILYIKKFLGFSKKWIQLIKECITTSKFSVLLNGSPYGPLLGPSSRGSSISLSFHSRY